MARRILVYSGEASDDLTEKTCAALRDGKKRRHPRVYHAQWKKRGWFNERTPMVQLQHLRDAAYVIFIQTLAPFDAAFVQLCAALRAARGSSAQRMIVVMPYYPGRQDKKDEPWVDITAKWALQLLEVAGGDRLERFVSFDLHSGSIQAYTDKPFDHLTALPHLLARLVHEKGITMSESSLGSPDTGGVKRVRNLSRLYGARNIVIIDKDRLSPGKSSVEAVIGDPADTLVFVDDIGDTLGSLVEGARAVRRKNGQARVYGILTHAVFGGTEHREKVIKNLMDGALEHLVVSDTIVVPPEILATGKVTVVSVAEILAEALRRIITGGSLTKMFKSVAVPSKDSEVCTE